ncbi:MAG: hypothetical protein EZS28_010666, partial [Streblomastix strix]
MCQIVYNGIQIVFVCKVKVCVRNGLEVVRLLGTGDNSYVSSTGAGAQAAALSNASIQLETGTGNKQSQSAQTNIPSVGKKGEIELFCSAIDDDKVFLIEFSVEKDLSDQEKQIECYYLSTDFETLFVYYARHAVNLSYQFPATQARDKIFLQMAEMIKYRVVPKSKKGAVVISMISDYEEDNERIEDVDECEKDLENEEECVSEDD